MRKFFISAVMAITITIFVTLFISISATPALALDKGTRIAIIPTVDATGGDVDFGAKLAARATAEAVKEFTAHGFTVIDDATITKATKLDMTDPENQKRSNVEDVGTNARADYALFIVITDASQQQHTNFFDATKEGIIKAKIIMMDVGNNQVCKPMNGIEFRASSKHHDYMGLGVGGSSYEMSAAEDVVRTTLKPWFDLNAPVH